MLKIVACILLVLALLAGACYEYAYPPSVYRHIAQRMLDSYVNAINSQNRGVIGSSLADTLDDPAQILLKVAFPAAPGQQQKDVMMEQFNKQDFLRFIDNTLYTTQNYALIADAKSVQLNADGKSGMLTFMARPEADGQAMDGNAHFIGESMCSAEMDFSVKESPKMRKLTCVMQLHIGAPRHYEK